MSSTIKPTEQKSAENPDEIESLNNKYLKKVLTSLILSPKPLEKLKLNFSSPPDLKMSSLLVPNIFNKESVMNYEVSAGQLTIE